MLEKIFGKKDDLDSTLKQLNKVIDRLNIAKDDCNNAINSGDSESEDQYLTKITELYDEFNQLSLKYFEFLLIEGQYQQGLDELESLTPINQSTETFLDDPIYDSVRAQNSINFEVYKAFFLFNLQKFRRALKSCEIILESNDSLDGIWELSGRTLIELGKPDEALEAFEAAIELEWHNADAWVGKAQILQASENLTEALEAFETALEIDDSNSDAIEGRDAILSQLNENGDESQESVKKQPDKTHAPSPSKRTLLKKEEVSHSSEVDVAENSNHAGTGYGEKKVFVKPQEKKNDDAKPRGFASVAGMLELKEILTRDVIKPLKNPEKYKKFQVTIPNGILLFGPPGCGKTFIVEKLAEEVGYNFKVVPPSKVGSKYIHETSDNIAKIFTEAKDNAPTILFFDEFEALVPKRESLGSEGQFKNEEINEFLTHLNNASSHGILVVGATNQVDLIDQAVMRAGRMDKVILVPPPDFEARKELFRSKITKVPHSSEIDFCKLAEKTDCYSSSDITAIIQAAGRIAGDQDLDEINEDLMLHVIEKQPPSISKSQIKSYEEFSRMERK